MRRFFGVIFSLWLLLASCWDAEAQVGSISRRPKSVPTRSRTGQFLVLGEISDLQERALNPILLPSSSQRSVAFTPLRPLDSQGVATLNPPIISVACERIKSEVLRILKIEDRFNGSIVVRIFPVDKRRPPAKILATQFADGWRYTLEIQDRVHWTLLVRTTVEALLLEVANRGNGDQLNPIPLWLSEGVTTLLIGESSRELVPQLNREFKDPNRSMNPLVAIASKTVGRSPVGFDALAFPTDALLSDTNQFQLFQGSAALFVHHLRSKGGGSSSLGALVFAFNRSLNWQTALLKTYPAEFQSLLDVEKWWAITSVAFYAQNASQFITPETLDRHLKSILQETVEVARSTNSPLGRRVLRLSETIEQWPLAAQIPVLERKMIQLRYLSNLGSRYFSRQGGGGTEPEMRVRFEQVRRLQEILNPYQKERSNTGNLARRGDVDPRIRVLVQSAADRLRSLEAEILGAPDARGNERVVEQSR